MKRVRRKGKPALGSGSKGGRKKNIASSESSVAVEAKSAPTAAPLAPDATRFTVAGTVRGADGKPLRKAAGRVFDQDMRSEQLLGAFVTDDLGRYLVSYGPARFSRAEKASADLVVRIYDARGREIAASPVRFNAGPDVTIDIEVQDASGGLSEFERILAALIAIAEGVPVGQLVDDDKHQDISFATGELGIERRLIEFVVLAHRLADRTKVAPATLYGLFRRGLPTNLAALALRGVPAWRQALEEALAANLVPPALAKQLDQEIAALRALAQARALATDQPGPPTFGRLLAANPRISAGERKKLVAAVMEVGADAADWDKLAAAHGIAAKTIAEMGYATRLFALLGDNAKLTKAVVGERKSSDPKAALRELAALPAGDWERRLAGTVKDDEVTVRAAEIAQRIERDMPTAVIAHRMRADREHGEPEVAAFLQANPDFDLLSTSVDTFLKERAGGKELDGLRAKLKRWQRLARLAPATERYAAMRGLKALGITSAIKAAWRSDLALRSTTVNALGASSDNGARQATRFSAASAGGDGARAMPGDSLVSPSGGGITDSLHAVAEWVSMAGITAGERVITPPGILRLLGDSDLGAVPAETGAPDWRALFGSLNACKCRHCGSVHGPAAYFVDLLHYIDRPIPRTSDRSAPTVNPLAELVKRRPDLPHIELSCDNSETPLPYIDLITEILELAVETPSGSGPFWAPPRTDEPHYDDLIERWQTRIAGPEDKLVLRMEPQNESAAAYARLVDAKFPWALPFDLDYEKRAVYLDHLGVRAEEVFEIFSLGDAAELARLRLGFTPAEWHIVRGAGLVEDARNALEFWGVTSLDALTPVPAFLKHAGLSFDQLEELTRLSYCPERIDIERREDPCNIDTFVVIHLNRTLLAELMRFLRLRRRLGWSIPDLDTCLGALGIATIDTMAFVKIAAFARLIERYDLPIATALRLFRSVPDAPARAERARVLGRIMGAHRVEAELYLELAGAPAVLDPEALTGILDGWEAIEPLALSVGECDYLLRHRDQTPPAFAPSEAELAAALDQLGEAVRSAFDVAPDASEPDRRERITLALVEALARQLAVPLADLRRCIVDETLVDGSERRAILRRDGRIAEAAAIEDFLPVVAAEPADDRARRRAASMLVRLRKTARLITALGLDARRLDAIEATRDDNDFLDFNRLPAAAEDPAATLSGLVALATATRISSEVAAGDRDLFDLLYAARTSTGPRDVDPVKISENTGWAPDLISSWLEAQKDDDADVLRKAATYRRAGRAIRLAVQLRTTPATLADWFTMRPPAAAAALRRHLQEVTYTGDVKALADALTLHMDRLRERKRDALLAWLLTNGTSPLTGERYRTAKDVYDALLIDPEMSACVTTARIKQATASVQLFVQRLLLRVEPGIAAVPALPDAAPLEAQRIVADLDAYWRRWDWMRNYRVWEAARKVLVAPENFLDPDLRDDKSPLFRAAEDELMQGELNDENIERAFHGYVDGLREIAHLDVRGICEDTDHDITHVFARTRSVPHVYYHRRRQIGADWTAWEQIDADIEGEHLIPVVHNNKITLLWPVFKQEQLNGSSARSKYSLAWTEQDNGAWSAKRMADAWQDADALDWEGASFAVDLDSKGNVRINIHSDSGSTPRSERFVFDACTEVLHLALDSVPYRYDAVRTFWPPNTLPYYSSFVKSSDIIDFFTVYSAGDEFGGTPVLLHDTPLGKYRLVVTLRYDLFPYRGHAAFSDEQHVYLLVPDPKHPYGIRPYRFEIFYHPYACEVASRLNEHGIEGLLAPAGGDPAQLDRQRRSEGLEMADRAAEPWKFATFYKPEFVSEPYPNEEFDFKSGAYSLYNWELFFHLPFLVAIRLSQDGQFEKARRWFHYIFDPTDSSGNPWPAKFWRTRPFYVKAMHGVETTDDLIRQIGATDTGAIDSWRDDPFNPHKIARVRIVAYMKAVVFKYLDNLIAWADDLFRRDTLETLNEATQLYVLAAELLGEKPTLVEAPERAADTYARLESRFDDIWEDLETSVAAVATTGSASSAPVFPPLFCLPPNDKLLEYWDTIADRLFKIRHCMDLEGRVRQLPLYEPPIDPMLLVRARAAGLDLRAVLASAAGEPVPRLRYRLLHQRALELVGDVRDLANSLLAALEKADGEDLAELRAQHEKELQEDLLAIRKQQIDELAATLEGLQKSKELVLARRMHYAGLAHISAKEQLHLSNLEAASAQQNSAAFSNLLSRELSLVPDFKVGALSTAGSTFGGSQLGTAAGMYAQAFDWNAALLTYHANRAAILGGFDRRQEDWDLQVELADKEIAQLDRQTLAAEIRLAIAENEMRHQERQIARAREAYDFLRQKFTNKELYRWLAGQLSALHYQAYAMAHDAANRAELAANFELGLYEREKLSLIRLDNWEPGRKGLLAAERLRQQLRRLDEAFLEKDRRTLELTKHVSLAQIDPMALAHLKWKGSCKFDVPEVVFDLDHGGHFLRRIKAVSLTIPCVVGPYGSVSARLELEHSWVRLTDTVAPDDVSMDFWKPDVDSIATSSAQRDAGVFELNFHDERLLPFEGAGVISRWKLELPHGAEGTPAIRQFDYQTISDVLLHFQYTAREGSGSRDLMAALNAFALPGSPPEDDRRPPLKRVLSMAHEFGTEWYRFLHPSPGAPSEVLTIPLSKRLFPYIFDALNVTITATSVYFVDGAGALTPLTGSAAPASPTVEHSEQPFAVLTRDQLASGPSNIRDCLAVLYFSVRASETRPD
jgi:hypothetical protein